MNLPAIQSAADRPLDEEWPRRLARGARRGSLVRIRQGCYVDAIKWKALDANQQYRLTLRAVLRTSNTPPLFAEESAAFLWGLPLPETPTMVDTLVPRGSGRRTGNGVRRIVRPAVGPSVPIGSFMVTGKIQTAVELALRYDFPWGVAVMDRALNAARLPVERRADPVSKPEVAAYIETLPTARARRKATRVLDFADGLGMLPGESLSRVHMAACGFEAPELQYEVYDSEGHAATVDFYWKAAGIVGEYDGLTKYLKPEYLRGRTASQVVIDEKIREDRIRSTGRHVVRWLWKTAVSPAALERCLRAAGVPQNATPLVF
ncbi:hypothetical protein GCM10027404_12060 [Arthrobacter tumbae]|uniref:hypothetical protein n=1 Tax=Arthrobacter tumbae TaxID=163874 RepID=UPI00195678B2|nr:hypothetical protein [Arthrobacter tumbae]MBM7782487.1 hypothetical protein [Arthrobacter tumbae]